MSENTSESHTHLGIRQREWEGTSGKTSGSVMEIHQDTKLICEYIRETKKHHL